MVSSIVGILGKVGMSIVMALLTEKVLIKIILIVLKKLVNSTKNSIDNDVLEAVEEALCPKDK